MRPAPSHFYVDCHAERGGNAFAETCLQQLKFADHPQCFLFSGHVGCGKSSELLHLKEQLSHSRLLPVYIDGSEYFNDYDGNVSDFFLPLVVELGQALSALEIGLNSSYLERKWEELSGLLQRKLAVEGVAPNWLSQLGVSVKLLSRDDEARSRAREWLEPQTSTLIEEVNRTFRGARLQLKKRGYHDLVVIFDNLEKIRRVGTRAQGEASQGVLFLDSAPQLTNLEVHVVYTVPLALVRSRGPELEANYGRSPFVLPMIKVEDRRHQPYSPGQEKLREILRRRLGGERLLQDVFTPEALDWLIRYSGGDVRALIRQVREAAALSAHPPIDLVAVQKALRQSIATYSASIPASHWPKLAALERDPHCAIDNNDPDYRAMLEQLTVLEYINGDSSDNLFESSAPWYAVNPIVRELKPFKQAVARLP